MDELVELKPIILDYDCQMRESTDLFLWPTSLLKGTL